MKKTILLALCFLLLLPVGCAGRGDPKQSETPSADSGDDDSTGYRFDYHYSAVAAFGTDTYVIETEDTVYYLCNNILYFSDKEYKEFIPLCPRPECDHKTSDCNAHIDPIGGFWIYDKYIYYASYDLGGKAPGDVPVKSASLWRIRLDGTAHEQVLVFDPVDLGFTPKRTKWSFNFIADRIYVTFSAYRDQTSLESSTAYGLVYLDEFKLPEYKTNSEDEKDEESLGGVWLSSDGNLIYELNTVSDGNTGDEPKYRLTQYDMDTDEYTVLADLAIRPEYLDGGFMVYDDAFYYNSFDGVNVHLHKVDFGSNDISDKIIKEGPYNEVRIAYFDWKYGTLIGHVKDPDGDPAKSGLYVYDTDLDLVDSLSYAGLPEDVMKISIFLQTDNYLFAALPKDDNSISCAYTIPTWYIDKSEIGTGNLAWRRWAPDGD